jgi:hypothetical protein
VQTKQQNAESRTYQNTEMHHQKGHQKNTDNLINVLMKPEKMEDKTPALFLKKKPKKRKRQHLSQGL